MVFGHRLYLGTGGMGRVGGSLGGIGSGFGGGIGEGGIGTGGGGGGSGSGGGDGTGGTCSTRYRHIQSGTHYP